MTKDPEPKTVTGRSGDDVFQNSNPARLSPLSAVGQTLSLHHLHPTGNKHGRREFRGAADPGQSCVLVEGPREERRGDPHDNQR